MTQDMHGWRRETLDAPVHSIDGIVRSGRHLVAPAFFVSSAHLSPLTFARLITIVIFSQMQLEENECRPRRRPGLLLDRRPLCREMAKDDRYRARRHVPSSRTTRSLAGLSRGVVSEAWFSRLRKTDPARSMLCSCYPVGVRNTPCSASDRPNVHGCFATLSGFSVWSGASMRSRGRSRCGLRMTGHLANIAGGLHTVRTSRGPPG